MDTQWLKEIKAIFFDIGDTLVDVDYIVNRSVHVATGLLLKEGVNISSTLFISVFLEEDRKYSVPHANHLYSNLEIVSNVFKSLDLPVSLSLTGRFLAYYRDSVRSSLVYNQSLFNYISLIKKSGYLLGIISDGSTIEQVEILTRLGIIRLFDQITISEDIGYEKPDHRIFERCFTDLQIEPKEALVIGDNCERDILGAKSVGAKAALIQSTSLGLYTCSPDLEMFSIYDLLPIISSGKCS